MHKIAILTAGGIAPCLSSAVAGLIERYTVTAPDSPIIGYRHGYAGLLLGDSIEVTPEVRATAHHLHDHGGSPLGNSRVKLTNRADCEKRGLVAAGVDPLQAAAERLVADGITILHTIGGDDTNTTAADLVTYLAMHNYRLTVVGLPKTIDNDVYPIRQTLGADTAAEQGAVFFENIANERNTGPRMLIVHEVMGRHSGWLTAATARAWRTRLDTLAFVPGFNLPRAAKDIDAVYVPELPFDLDGEAARLKRVMDAKGSVIIFLSEGACSDAVVADMETRGEAVARDAFGHVRLDSVNTGAWFGKQFGKRLGAEKTLVQKSGYFARSAAANAFDRKLIREMANLAADSALQGISGVIGHDEDQGDALRAIEFARIKGGKPFDPAVAWFRQMLGAIGQA